jgi:nucleoside-diphosphate-sugar epimerase
LKKKKGGIFNVSGDGLMSFEEMVRILGNIRIPLPSNFLFVLNQLAWSLRLKFLSEFPSSALNMIRYSWWASNEKLKRALGFQFKYNTEKAFMDFAAFVKGQKKTN